MVSERKSPSHQGSMTSARHGSRSRELRDHLNHKQEVPSELVVKQAM